MDKQFLLKQIELLTDKGIGLISLSSITGKNNTKKNYGMALRDFGYGGDSWINIKNMSYEDIKKDIYRDISGFIIKTGKYNNIVCIDWDNKQHIIDTYKAVEQRLRNGEIISNTDKDMITYNNYIKSLSIRDELIKKEFLYAKTPSGGYHFICKYDENIFTTNNRGLLGNIDIRTDGGCIFFGIRDDGRYEYNDCKIKAVPKKITDILYPIIKNKIDANIIKSDPNIIDDKYYNNCINNKCLYKYDISENVFECYIILLLKVLPNFLDIYDSWYTFTIISKKLDFKKLWDKLSKISKKYDRRENRKIWNSINVLETVVDVNYIVDLLRKKEVKVPYIQTIYYNYNPIKTYDGLDIDHINERYLNKNIYENNKHITIINSGVCTAKTTSAFDYSISENIPIISIVHLKNLGGNQLDNYNNKLKKKFKELGYSSSDYENYKMIIYDNKTDLKKLTKRNSILTTINNLSKILNTNYFNDYTTVVMDMINNYLIFLDEGGRQIHNLYTSPTLSTKRKDTIYSLEKAIKGSKKVIVSDGTIDDLTIDYFKQYNPKYILNSHKSYNNPFSFYHSMNGKINNIFEKNMIELLKINKQFTICCNTKKDAVYYRTFLLNTKLLRIEDIAFYTADDGDGIVKNATYEWKDKKVIIYSPSIVEGVDYMSDEPISVFCIINGSETLNVEQSKQQICRARNILEVKILICSLSNKLTYNNYEELYNALLKGIKSDISNNYFIEVGETNNKIKQTNILEEFNNLKVEDYDESTNKLIKISGDDCKRFTISLYIDNTNKQNAIYTLRTILIKIGMFEYEDIDYIKNIAMADKKIKEKLNEKNDYIYQTLEQIDESNEYMLFEKTKITNSKLSQLHDYVNDKPDNNNNMRFRKFLEGDNYPEITNDTAIGRLQMLGINKYLIKNILYGNKNLCKLLNNLYNNCDIKTNLISLILNESHTIFKSYDNIKYFILNDYELDNKIKELCETEHYGNIYRSTGYKIKIYKLLMRKYACNVNWYDFNYTTADPYIQKDISITIEDFNIYKNLSLKSKKSLDTIRTRKDFLNNMMMPIIIDIIGYSNIKKETINTKVCGKKITDKKYDIRDYISQTINLYHLGNKIRYDKLDKDIHINYLKDLQSHENSIREYYNNNKEDTDINWIEEE